MTGLRPSAAGLLWYRILWTWPIMLRVVVLATHVETDICRCGSVIRKTYLRYVMSLQSVAGAMVLAVATLVIVKAVGMWKRAILAQIAVM